MRVKMNVNDLSNSIVQQDLNLFIKDSNYLVRSLSGKSILITGSTGLIGSFLVFALNALCELSGIHCNIIAHGRSREKLLKVYGACNGKNIVQNSDDFDELRTFHKKIDFIVHAASPTASQDFYSKPVEVIDSIYSTTKKVLELARVHQSESVVFLSSMEVYGQVLNESELTEDMLGRLDLTSQRASYPMSKRLSELLCTCAFHEWQIPVKVARLSMVFGPGVQSSDKRVLNYFLQQIKNREDIYLKTPGNSKSTVLYLREAAEAICWLLIYGVNGEIYNVANPKNYYSIFEMAKIASSISDVKVFKPETRNDDSNIYPSDTFLRLSIKKIQNLGWQPYVGLASILQRVLKYQEESL